MHSDHNASCFFGDLGGLIYSLVAATSKGLRKFAIWTLILILCGLIIFGGFIVSSIVMQSAGSG